MSIGKGLIRSCLGAMALFVLQGATPALAAEDAHRAAVDDALAKWKAGGHSRPIVETHIHFWQVTRPGGVPWPTPAEGPIFRDVLPAEYSAFARAHGVVAAGVVEASGIVEDNQWVLDRIKGDGLLFVLRRQSRDGAPTFAQDPWRALARIRAGWDPRLPHRSQRRHHAESRRSWRTCGILHGAA